MANEQNLIPSNQRTPKERREIARKGGIASGKKRKQIKSFREAAQWALEMSTKANIGGEVESITQYQRIMLTLLKYLQDESNPKLFLQAAQMLHQFRNSGYAEEKMVAEIERIKAETERMKGTGEQKNGMLEKLIEGLRDDIHEETESAHDAVENGESEAPEHT